MNKLYNKIYNAVNEGIQKALLIDPEQNDVSINYSYHKIDNELDIQQLLNNAVHKFIENSNINNYNDILIYSKNGEYQYKVNDFYKLFNIFNKISNITDNINLSWIDTQNVLTFIMNDNRKLSLNEIDNKDDIVFIKFDNIENLNHPIIIHKNLLIDKKIWREKYEEIKWEKVKRNNGYNNTKIIKNMIYIKYPAFEYCINFKNYYPILNLSNYEAYLPAIDELKILHKNINLINYILNYINGKELNINSGNWWSSTQYGTTTVWILRNNSFTGNDMDHYAQVLPLFAKIN